MSQRRFEASLYDEHTAGRLAWILGEGSAAARALAELARRRGKGEDVALFEGGGMFIVGPRPVAKDAAR